MNVSESPSESKESYKLQIFIEVVVWFMLVANVHILGYQQWYYYLGAVLAYFGFKITFAAGYEKFKLTEFYAEYKNFMFFMPSLSMLICYFASLFFFFPKINNKPLAPTVTNQVSSTSVNKESTTLTTKEEKIDEDMSDELKAISNLQINKDFSEEFSLPRELGELIKNKDIPTSDKLLLERDSIKIMLQYEKILRDFNLIQLEEIRFLKKIQSFKDIQPLEESESSKSEISNIKLEKK